MDESLGSRIGAMCAHLGGIRRASRLIGVSESQVHRWIRAENAPPAPAVFRLAALAGVSSEWLVTGQGVMEAGAAALRAGEGAAERGGEFVHVPRLEGGTPDAPAPGAADGLVFRRRWVHEVLRVPPEELRCLTMDGESMAPTLRAGDVVVIHQAGERDLSRDGIYVLRINNTLLVKHLQQLDGRRVRVASENAAYISFTVSLDSERDDVTIYGRVVCMIRPM